MSDVNLCACESISYVCMHVCMHVNIKSIECNCEHGGVATSVHSTRVDLSCRLERRRVDWLHILVGGLACRARGHFVPSIYSPTCVYTYVFVVYIIVHVSSSLSPLSRSTGSIILFILSSHLLFLTSICIYILCLCIVCIYF